jgi:hypothetical protein
MKRSDWIAICSMIVGVFITTIGSVVYLSFKIGGLTEKLMSMERTMENMAERIPRMEVEIAEIRVKVDALWQRDISKTKTIKDKVVADLGFKAD